MTPNEQRAAQLLATKQWFNGTNDMAKALSAAGLLVTPDHEAALAACEAIYVAEHGPEDGRAPGHWTPRERASHRTAAEVGRRSLDAKKPKERWTVHAWPKAGSCWHVVDANDCSDGHIVSRACAWFTCEAEARAYAAEQNAKEAVR